MFESLGIESSDEPLKLLELPSQPSPLWSLTSQVVFTVRCTVQDENRTDQSGCGVGKLEIFTRCQAFSPIE